MPKIIENDDKTNKEIIPKDIDPKERQQCFVIMPIGDHSSHEKGHFFKIYRDLIKPAIEDAGFESYRADEGGGSQNIQIDIIKKIIEAPMAVCDLSTRNPNVLFELGIRQAFDLPVALIQEAGTERIFDISTFNTGEYRSERIYDEIVQDRESISNLIKTTFKKHNEGDGINSIIRLIPTLNKAKLSGKDISSNELIKIMFNQMNNLTDEVLSLKRDLTRKSFKCNDDVALDMNDNIVNLHLPNEISMRDEKIYRLLSGLDGKQHSIVDVARTMGMKTSDVMNSYKKISDYLETMGLNTKPVKYRILNE